MSESTPMIDPEDNVDNAKMGSGIDSKEHRFPFCIVWTPLPLITWLFPFIGHMGIAYSTGVIRDFAGPYYVSEDDMAFGWPTRYWRLEPAKARGGANGFDEAVTKASDIYKSRMHNLFCDNCHSHVATAMEIMDYDGSKWNMVKLAALMLVKGRFVGFTGFLKTWLPFIVIWSLVVGIVLATQLK